MPDTITNDQVVAWVRAFAAQVAEQKSALTKLDAAIGDGDHGTNMDRGMRKVLEKLDAANSGGGHHRVGSYGTGADARYDLPRIGTTSATGVSALMPVKIAPTRSVAARSGSSNR